MALGEPARQSSADHKPVSGTAGIDHGLDEFGNLFGGQGWARLIEFASGAVFLDHRDIGPGGAGDGHGPVWQARKVEQVDQLISGRAAYRKHGKNWQTMAVQRQANIDP